MMQKCDRVDWSYYDKFNTLIDKYLPRQGEGENMATQIVTVVNKLVYKWYNDGDVYDNTHMLDGWCNDLSSYATYINNTPMTMSISINYSNFGEIEDIEIPEN